MYVCISYNTGKSPLPDIYAQCPRARSARGRVHIYQATHECLCYNYVIYTTSSTRIHRESLAQ